jgi:hypothetical protein
VRSGVPGVFFLSAPPKCGRFGSSARPHPCIRDWLWEEVAGACLLLLLLLQHLPGSRDPAPVTAAASAVTSPAQGARAPW